MLLKHLLMSSQKSDLDHQPHIYQSVVLYPISQTADPHLNLLTSNHYTITFFITIHISLSCSSGQSFEIYKTFIHFLIHCIPALPQQTQSIFTIYIRNRKGGSMRVNLCNSCSHYQRYGLLTMMQKLDQTLNVVVSS